MNIFIITVQDETGRHVEAATLDMEQAIISADKMADGYIMRGFVVLSVLTPKETPEPEGPHVVRFYDLKNRKTRQRVNIEVLKMSEADNTDY